MSEIGFSETRTACRSGLHEKVQPAPLLTDAERKRAFAMFGGNRALRRRIKADARRASLAKDQ